MTAHDPRLRVLMVLTSHATLGDTGRATGLWLEEFAAPYYVLTDAGIGVTLSSPLGGQPPIDPVSDEPTGQTDDTRRFHEDVAAQERLASPFRSPMSRQVTSTRCSSLGAMGPCGTSRTTGVRSA
jgi:putative intracellular protease/amidase